MSKNIEHNNQQPIPQQITAQQFLYKLFDKFDTNSDGRLSKFEFRQAMKYLTRVLGVTLPNRQDSKNVFNCLDVDSDQTITKKQFRQLTASFQLLIQQIGVKLLYKGNIK